MPESDSSDGIISRNDLEELADLFDGFEFALDPTSTHAKEAESKFNDHVKYLYVAKVVPQHPTFSLDCFEAKIRTMCRGIIKRKKEQKRSLG